VGRTKEKQGVKNIKEKCLKRREKGMGKKRMRKVERKIIRRKEEEGTKK
jgi:hypothetical protein